MIKMHAERRKKWLTWKSLWNCFQFSLAILIIVGIFEFAQRIIISELPIIQKTLFFLVMWALLSVGIWAYGLLFPELTNVVFKMLGFNEEEQEEKNESQKTSHSEHGKKEKRILDFNVGTKLALLIFGLFAIGSFFIILIGIYLHLEIGIEPTFLIVVFSPLFAALFGATTLIWGKLRDSLSEKFKYHQTDLTKIYSHFKHTSPLTIKNHLEDMKKSRDDLKTYGKFMYILIYPKKLPERIDQFLSLYKDFDEKLQKIIQIAGIDPGYGANIETLYYHLGFAGAQNYNPTKDFSKKAEELRKSYAKLVSESKVLWDDLSTIKRQIVEELAVFSIANNFRLEAVI